MVSPLQNLIRKEINKGLGPQMLDGTLRRATPSSSLDSYGDATATTYATYTLKGEVDQYSAYYKSVAGIPDTDVKLIIIGGSLSVTPQKDDQVKFRSTWYKVRRITKVDPALAAYELQAFEIPDPTV